MIKITDNNIKQTIYLSGVRHEDLENMVNYMYKGIVSLPIEELESFLILAREFQLDVDNQSSQLEDDGHICHGPSAKKSRIEQIFEENVKQELKFEEAEKESELPDEGEGPPCNCCDIT